MLAGGYAGALQPMAADYVRAILDSVSRLSLLIDNVLDLTQSDTGSLLLAEEEVDLHTLCIEAGEDVREPASAKAIEVEIQADPSVGTIGGDRSRLRQSLDNLLRNALAYTPAGGRILLYAVGDAEAAEITVSDNGAGIAPADQSRVFDRFYRNMVGGEGRDEALGLGLPLAKQFVEAHGGSIHLQSELGQGTTVTIRLPRSRP
jgi:signal transduction histidine kinase